MPPPRREVAGGFGPLRARCLECKKIFRPNARLKSRQRTCGQPTCRLQSRARYQKEYRRLNPQLELEYREKRKNQHSPDFWKNYRSTHPVSTKRNRDASRLRKRLKRDGLQRKLDIVQVIDPPGYFDRYHGFATRHRWLIKEVAGICAA